MYSVKKNFKKSSWVESTACDRHFMISYFFPHFSWHILDREIVREDGEERSRISPWSFCGAVFCNLLLKCKVKLAAKCSFNAITYSMPVINHTFMKFRMSILQSCAFKEVLNKLQDL